MPQMKPRFEYYESPGWGGAPRRSWVLRHENGAIEVWVNETEFMTGGIEVHHRTGDGDPDHAACAILGGACWHDGSSLNFEPIRKLMLAKAPEPVVTALIAKTLEGWAKSQFEEE
jgi:hypothetical protein